MCIINTYFKEIIMCNIKAQADFPLEYSSTILKLYDCICGEPKRTEN